MPRECRVVRPLARPCCEAARRRAPTSPPRRGGRSRLQHTPRARRSAAGGRGAHRRHVGGDEAGRHRVGGDAAARPLARGGLGQADHAGLGRAVVGLCAGGGRGARRGEPRRREAGCAPQGPRTACAASGLPASSAHKWPPDTRQQLAAELDRGARTQVSKTIREPRPTWPALPVRPTTEAMLTMRPRRCLPITLVAAWRGRQARAGGVVCAGRSRGAARPQ